MVVAKGISQQQMCRGRYGWTVSYPVIKLSLNVPVEFLFHWFSACLVVLVRVQSCCLLSSP